MAPSLETTEQVLGVVEDYDLLLHRALQIVNDAPFGCGLNRRRAFLRFGQAVASVLYG